MQPFDDEQRRNIANLESFYEQLVLAARELDGPYRGSLRWKFASGRQYLYQRRSDNPLVDTSLGLRSEQTEARMVAFQQGKAAATVRHQKALNETQRFAKIARTLGLGLVPAQAARVLRHLDLRAMLGRPLLAVGTIAMPVYEIEAGGRIFHGFDATQDFDLTWRGTDPLHLQSAGTISILDTLREIDPLYTKNTERSFQAVSGNYEVEVLAAPSTLASFPKNDLVPLRGLVEQEWLLLGQPVRHIACAMDGTPAPIAAPDPRWMALHKLWLSQKPQRHAVKKPKDQAQGLLLLRALLEAMPAYSLDDEFVSAVPKELRGFLRSGVDWAIKNPSSKEAEDAFTASAPLDKDVLKKIRRTPAVPLKFPAEYPGASETLRRWPRGF